MTQEEKQLLFKDLCARLPYGVKVRLDTGDKAFDTDLVGLPSNNTVNIHDKENYETIEECFIGNIKPYLRPMSSMSIDESFKLEDIMLDFGSFSVMTDIVDFYNAHHLDHYNLIEKGLALKAPEGMYKIE